MLTPFGVGVLMFVWVLGRTFLSLSVIHVFFVIIAEIQPIKLRKFNA